MLPQNYSYKIDPIINPIQGEVTVSGAKNSVLPIICASLLNNLSTQLSNVPNLNDVSILLELINSMGVTTEHSIEKESLKINGFTTDNKQVDIMSDNTRKIRYSLLLMGAMLGKGVKKIRINLPGGCSFSERPYEIHLNGFEQMGCDIIQYPAHIEITVPTELKPSTIRLRFPSVGATENLILAACGVDGVTELQNIAIEPEIIDLINYLKKLNIKIDFIGHRKLKIDSRSKRSLTTTHTIIPDRIETISWVILGALSSKNGITIKNIHIEHLFAPLLELEKIGVFVTVLNNTIYVKQNNLLISSALISDVYPMLGTDYLPLFAVLLSTSKGDSTLTDTIYPKRFEYLDELSKMGLQYNQEKGSSIIEGRTHYVPNSVKSTDLRGGFATLLAGILSQKETTIAHAYQIDRGYANLIEKMKNIGITIKKVDIN